MSGAAVKYDFGFFEDWKASCRVRRIQEKYNELAASAKQNGTTPEAEMNAKYKDQAAFFRACPEFDLLCWPSELAELGSGIVLYFHFLAFLVCFLALALLFMLYPIGYYSSEGRLDSWNWNPDGFTTEDTDRCKCLGSNSGLLPQGASSDYGSSCAAWDRDLCTGFTSDIGEWCCRSWCYAEEDCTQTQSGSDSNVKVVSGSAPLVRSYTACEDAQADLDYCASGVLAQDVRYPGAVAYDQENCMTEAIYADATPGNLGPDGGTEEAVLVVHVVILVLLCLAIVLKAQYQDRVEVQVDARNVQPNDYAVLVSGLPTSATDESQIAEWFQNNAVEGSKPEVVKVVIGWDAAEYREKMAKLKAIMEQLKATDPKEQEEEYKRLQAEAAEIRKDFMSSAPTIAARLTSSGYVVIIFRYQEDQRRCLERWDTIWGRWFNREAGGCRGVMPGTPLPRYPIGTTPVCRLRVCRAPNPQDINWEDLGVPLKEKLIRLVKTNVAMALLILICFGVCYFVKWLSRGSGGACHREAVFSGTGTSVLPALAIACANGAVNVAAKRFGRYEYHDTKGAEVASQALKMGLAMIVNTSGVLLFVNGQPKEWYAAGGLLDDLISLILIVGCLRPLMLLLDLPYYIRLLLRKCSKKKQLTQAKLDQWNEVENRGAPKTKEEAKELKQVRSQVDFFKKMTEPSEMLMTRRYAYAVNIFMCALLYMPVMPLIPVLGILSLCIQFCVDKYLIVRWFKRPPSHDSQEAKGSLHFIRFLGCILFPVAVVFFLNVSWEDKGACWRWFAPSLAFGVGFALVPLQVTRAALGLHCLLASKRHLLVQDAALSQDYYEAQHMWSKEDKYHLSHFLYKGLPGSVNPENLSPGTSATSMKAVQDSYGTSAAKGAAAVMGDEEPAGPSPGSGTGADATTVDAPKPVTYGAAYAPTEVVSATSGKDVSKDEPSAVSSTPEPAVMEPAEPPAATGGVAATGTESHPVWEYEGGHGAYQKYADDCHGFIERKYQEYRSSRGRNRVKVTTGGIALSLDFEKMTQMVIQDGKPHSKVRRIRRREEC